MLKLAETVSSTEQLLTTTPELDETVSSTKELLTTTPELVETVPSTEQLLTTTPELDETVPSTKELLTTTPELVETVPSTEQLLTTTPELDETVPSTEQLLTTTPELDETVPSTKELLTITTELDGTVPSTEQLLTTTSELDETVPTHEQLLTTTPKLDETVPSTEQLLTTTPELDETVPSTEQLLTTTPELDETVPSTEQLLTTTPELDETVPSTKELLTSTSIQPKHTVNTTSTLRTAGYSDIINTADFETPDFGTFGTELFTTERNKPSTKIFDVTTKKTTRAPTSRSTSSVTPEKTRYPPTTLPVFKGTDAQKTVVIEIKVLDESSQGCNPTDQSTCEDFKAYFKNQLIATYSTIEGFSDIVIDRLRKGSIIVSHTVVYSYNDMTAADRGLTADEIYSQTVGPGIQNGKIGGLKVDSCDHCDDPKETTDLCSMKGNAECAISHMEVKCDPASNYVLCVSPCADTDDPFCASAGECHQQEGYEAECECSRDDTGFYFGDRCSNYFNQRATILGVAITGGFIFGIIVTIVIIRCRRRRRRMGGYRQYYTDDMGEEGYLWNESYASTEKRKH
ncbi:hypothetical protein BSL78_15898 [Apostichopus japonicus]|uniref:Uncharacterized protein n=1 Tax=Stichopus japonicus TaxID=307972 RepID=A0A2G8KGZ9_STIJA|nr:hypothetical protein BSL78_15898 [Apostichopus japonicus]